MFECNPAFALLVREPLFDMLFVNHEKNSNVP